MPPTGPRKGCSLPSYAPDVEKGHCDQTAANGTDLDLLKVLRIAILILAHVTFVLANLYLYDYISTFIIEYL